MRAAVISDFNEPLIVENVPDPQCPAHGVVIDVKACGVCRSDWHAWKGADQDVCIPHIPGHEFSGVILETGDDCTHVKVGDRVTAPFILGCGLCSDSLCGQATICDQQRLIGFTEPGAFAQMLVVPHADFNLVRLPDEIDFVEAAAMGCRLTTAFQALVDRARLKPDQWLAVHGCGGVGLSAIMIANAIGAKVVAVDINDDALLLAEQMGALATLNASAVDDVGQAVRQITDGGADVSLEALGLTETFHNSLNSLRKLGRHIQVGLPTGIHAAPTLPLLDLIYSRQLSMMGTRGLTAQRFPELLAMIAAGQINPSRLIAKTISLGQAGAALIAMNEYTGVGITVINVF